MADHPAPPHPGSALPPPAFRSLLVVFDQTNQDPATLAAAAEIAIRSDTSTLTASTIFAYRGEREPRREEYLEAQAAALAHTARIPVSKLPEEDAPIDPHREPYEQILDWRADKSADLIVVSAPYLDDFWKLGRVSAGATLDVLMARSPKPLFIIRQPPAKGDPALPADVLLPILPRCPAIADSASWALHLVRPNAAIHILITLPEGYPAGALAPLIGRDVDPASLTAEALSELGNFAGAEAPGLLASLARDAAKKNATTTFSVRSGEFVRSALSVISGTPFPEGGSEDAPVHRVIAILGCPADPSFEGHQLCAALVRNLSGPVLITTGP